MILQQIHEWLDKMKKECRHKKNWDGKTQIQPCSCIFGDIGGYNQAISDIQAILPSIIQDVDKDAYAKGYEAARKQITGVLAHSQ